MESEKSTYIAYDELCQNDPGQSDYRFCATIQRWAAERRSFEVNYLDRQNKVYAVRKSSLRAALATKIREQLALSRNVLVVLSSDTRKSGSLLAFEIEETVDTFNLPLILAYIDFKAVADPSALAGYWPDALRQRINSGSARAIHIPFNKHAILDAASQFTDTNRPLTGLNHYTEYAHRKFNCISPDMAFGNCMRQKRFVAGS
ncbi:MAG: hypothetical protein HGB29_08255 [Chlorobiaceae bacterium]|nr:hypothetical protein [Chlorobiaceae bacterium]NTW74841.1 hypothetical protein [Chlorobiaceae bacterium]